MLDRRLAEDDGGVEQPGVAVIANEALRPLRADAGSIRRDEDEGLVMRGTREAVSDLQHGRGRRSAGDRPAPPRDVTRRDQGDLAV